MLLSLLIPHALVEDSACDAADHMLKGLEA